MSEIGRRGRTFPAPLRTIGTAVVLLCTLGGCASPAIQFHSLVAPDATLPQPPPAAAAYAIALDPVSVPRQADMAPLVVGTRDGVLKLAEGHRWIAPLGDEIRAALSQHLQSRLHVADLGRVSAPAGTRVFLVRVDVQRFEALRGESVRVDAQWSLRESGSAAATASCMSRALESAGADYDALVDAYRRALASIAAQIADGLRARARTPVPYTCPSEATHAG